MERQGIKWQVVLSALLLAVLMGSIFFPVFRLTGERYITSAVKVNIYAEKMDAAAAKAAGTKKVIESCQENTTSRREQAEEFGKRMKKGSDRISGLRFIQWGLSAEKELVFPGIAYVSQSDLEKSGANKVFRIMAMLLLLPILLAMANLIFILVRRKTYSGWIGITGLVEILFQILFWKLTPGMIWAKLADDMKSFPLIHEKTMQIPGMGNYAVRSIMGGFVSTEFYVGMTVGWILLLFSILLITVCRPRRIEMKKDMRQVSRVWEFIIAGTMCLVCMGALFSYLFWGYGAFEKADGKEAAVALPTGERNTPSEQDVLKEKVVRYNMAQTKEQKNNTSIEDDKGISMIRGQVRSAKNAALPGVKVTLYSKTYGCQLYVGTTDANGYYKIFVPAQEEKYEIIFSMVKKACKETMYHVDLGQNDFIQSEKMVYMAEDASVRNYMVWLRDSTEEIEDKVGGINDAELIFRRGVNNYDGDIRLSMYTNGTGCADVLLEPGMYTVEVSKNGYMQQYRNIFFDMESDGKMRILLTPKG